MPLDLPSVGASLTVQGIGSPPMESPTSTPGDHQHPTETGTPVESATPAPSPNGTLTGQVVAGKSVNVNLIDANNVVVTSITANPDGTFSVTALAGNYTVVATASGFLSHQGSVILTGGNTTVLPAVNLVAGDVDGTA